MKASIVLLPTLLGAALALKIGDKVHKKITQLENGVWGGNDDGSFTFLAPHQDHDHVSTDAHDARSPSLVASRSSVFPGKVTCDSAEGVVDSYDLTNAQLDFAYYCGAKKPVKKHSYAFAVFDQALVYMCEQGDHTGYCKAPEFNAAVAEIKAGCPGTESGWSTHKKWYKTYGYKVASDDKVCGKRPH